MENAQYGKRVMFHITDVIQKVDTDKTCVEYLRTIGYGDVLLMDGEVQFSTQDEYRYHETLVHPVMNQFNDVNNLNVLIIGGGDGLAAREVYKWLNVQSVTVVDHDSEFVELFGKRLFSVQNKCVFSRSSLTYVCQDASVFLENTSNFYNIIIIDLPDPDSQEMVDLYSDIIVKCKSVLTNSGAISTHVGPALLKADDKQWKTIGNIKDMLLHTFRGSVQFNTCYVPSFSNEWAFLYMVSNPPPYIERRKTPFVMDQCHFWNPELKTVPTDIQDIYRRLL